VEGERLTLRGAVLTPDGKQRVAAETSGAAAEAEIVGQRLAEMLCDRGAGELLVMRGG
jgi:porphobilinogen deaminase